MTKFETLLNETGFAYEAEQDAGDVMFLIQGEKYLVSVTETEEGDFECVTTNMATAQRLMDKGMKDVTKADGNRKTFKSPKSAINYIEKWAKYNGKPPKKVSASKQITEPVIVRCPAFADEEGYLLNLPSFEEKRKELKEISEEIGAHKHTDIESQVFWMLAKRGRVLTSTQRLVDLAREVLEARGYEVTVEIANPMRTGRN
ncbi:hypothetical protein [Bacillus sp. SN10]|uniref:hypothetical protein n=1 Tax=Bacillus sp. SN10 TaxID=2056493 RepID=UPI0018E3B377|nr:hypothetical protein [Bacillus sp. SN10]